MAKQSDKNQNRKKRKKSSPKKLNLHCSVHFLDQSNQLFHLNARENGLELLNQVEKHLKLLEPKYFGLVYLDRDGNQCWLEVNKSLSHQFKCSSGEIDLSFRVKFYVEHPARLAVEQTRWLFFLQSWIQTANGALETSPQTGCLLTSYFLQATLGPILSEAEDNLNISKLNPLPGFVRENVPVVIELRQLLKDQTADEAQNRFLDHIRRVDRYGVEFHPARDGQGKNIELGISGRAVTVHRAGIAKTRINTFAWCRILRVFYKRKRFFIQLQREKFEEYDTVVGFRAPSTRAAKRLWRSCTEQHSFFRTFRPINPLPPNSKPKGISSLLKPLKSCFYDTGESGSASSGHHQSITYRRYDLHRVASTHPGGASVGSPSPRPAWSSAADETDEPLESSMDDLKTSLKMMVHHQHPFNYSSTCSGSAASPISSLAFKGPPSGSFNYADDSCATDGSSSSTHNSTAPEEISDQFQGRILGIPAPLPVDGVYQVRLEPDAEGLFGLNLRYENHYGHLGTARLSRLLPDSSADLCYPRLRIGDELLDVDGHPIECFKSQEELVRLFRNAAGQKTPLTLSLRRCRIVDPEEEIADAGRVIEYHSYNLTNGISAVESVERLSEELRNGRIISQFGLLAKSRPELSTSVARAEANIDKNRYADIYPYDCNRIILGSSARFADLDYPGDDDECQDYINASYITMPSSGAAGSNLLHYIATQGPLPHTVEDFWSLVWQEGVQTVAMVTPEEERGRVKCHRYWPEEDEIVRAGDLIVSCQFIRHSGHFIHRQLLLTHHQAEEEVRIVEHIQYLDWPDHGAPMSSSGQFIDYVRFARHLNSQLVEREDVIRPILVHCSAGIGRTGAFILLDSALSLLDAGMPVDPLNLVRLMRDQRPMMLQTSVQFQYVCDCIVDSFHQSH